MSWFVKFTTGGLLAAGGVLLYRSEIEATSSALSASLHDLSARLESLAPAPTQPLGQFPEPIPQRLELTENLKARWNEKLLYGANAIRTTDWSAVAAQGWSDLKALKERVAPSAEEVVAEAKGAEKQV